MALIALWLHCSCRRGDTLPSCGFQLTVLNLFLSTCLFLMCLKWAEGSRQEPCRAAELGTKHSFLLLGTDNSTSTVSAFSEDWLKTHTVKAVTKVLHHLFKCTEPAVLCPTLLLSVFISVKATQQSLTASSARNKLCGNGVIYN